MTIESHHISFAKMVDLAEHRLPESERAASLSHIAQCSQCATESAQLAKTLELIRTDKSEDAPPYLIARAVSLFGEPAVSTTPTFVERIVATLIFDSWTNSPAFGVRSSGQAKERQLLFNTGESDLDLRVKHAGEEWIVSGQVLGSECSAGGYIELEGECGTAQTELNDLCEFTLSPVPAGSYRLRLRLTGIEVEVPQLELRA